MSDGEPEIIGSARRHAISDDDMRHAFSNPIRIFKFDEGLTVVVGGTRTGALLEVGVVYEESGPVIVHAMPARDRFLR